MIELHDAGQWATIVVGGLALLAYFQRRARRIEKIEQNARVMRERIDQNRKAVKNRRRDQRALYPKLDTILTRLTAIETNVAHLAADIEGLPPSGRPRKRKRRK